MFLECVIIIRTNIKCRNNKWILINNKMTLLYVIGFSIEGSSCRKVVGGKAGVSIFHVHDKCAEHRYPTFFTTGKADAEIHYKCRLPNSKQ